MGTQWKPFYERDLTLPDTIVKCRGQEAAKRQRAEITGNSSDSSVNVKKTRTPNPSHTRVCPGCAANG